MAKKFLFDSIFPGEGPIHVLQARVSNSFYQAIEVEAARREMTVSELLRGLIGFYFAPEVLAEKIRQGGELDSRDKEVIESCHEYVLALANNLEKVGKLHEKARISQIKSETAKLLSEEDTRGQLIDEVAKRVAEMIFGKSRSKAEAQKKLEALFKTSQKGGKNKK